MKWILPAAVGLAVTVGIADAADPVIAVHYQATCDLCVIDRCGVHGPNAIGLPCSGYETTAQAPPPPANPFVYIVVARTEQSAGVAGATFGIAYSEDVYVSNWDLCGDEEFPRDNVRGDPWPASGSGNRILWNSETNCQRFELGSDGVHAIAGSFYVYSYLVGGDFNQADGYFAVTPDSSSTPPGMSVIQCDDVVVPIESDGGVMGFGGVAGFNPCGVTPVEATTWGRVKAKYDRPGAN